MTPSQHGLSQQTEDAIVNLLMTRLLDKTDHDGRSMYRVVMDALTDTDRALVEAALERHAARQRAAGKPGW